MAVLIQPLAQSESKGRFMRRLGLDPTNSEHKIVYGLMKAEAIRDRETMMNSRDILLLHLRHDMSIQPPYSISQVTEIAIRTAVLRIYASACPETKAYYEKGHDNTGADEDDGLPPEENWIIRWMLWHVFRYRDNRNKHRPPSSQVSPTSSTHPRFFMDDVLSTTTTTSTSTEHRTASPIATAAAANAVVAATSTVCTVQLGSYNVGKMMSHRRAYILPAAAPTPAQLSPSVYRTLPYDPTRDP